MKKTKINPKVTRLGRIFTRLFGDENGAVMMEYVVLAVLLVAGVVAIVIAFGGAIAKQFQGAGEAVQGRTGTAGQTLQDGRDEFDSGAKSAQEYQTITTGGEFQSTTTTTGTTTGD